jgi:hypothetical protein
MEILQSVLSTEVMIAGRQVADAIDVAMTLVIRSSYRIFIKRKIYVQLVYVAFTNAAMSSGRALGGSF